MLQVKHKRCFTESLAVAALCPAGEGLPVLDAVLDVFLTLPGHTRIREDERQPVVERVKPGGMDAECK